MYADFFGLRCLPFEERADTQFFFATAECDEALAALRYQAQFGKGMSLLLGDCGAGKTLLIRTLVLRMDTSDNVVVLTRAPVEEASILRESCKAFGVTLPSSETPARCLVRIRRHLIRTAEAKRRSILIIDQAENLTVEDVRHLATLSELENDGEGLVTLLLVGQPHFKRTLAKPEFARLDQQLFGRRVLPEFDLVQTGQYIRHRLAVAGGGEAEVFSPDAVAIIQAAAKGVPRLINSICSAAMLAAYGAGQRYITKEMAIEVAQASALRERTAAVSHVGLSSASKLGGTQPGAAIPDVAPWYQHEPSQTVPDDGTDGFLGDTDFYSQLSGIRDSLEELISPGSGDGAVQTAASTSVALLGVEGDALVDRMESTIARAERVSATSQAALVQQSAVEKHLTSLSVRAERLIEGLGHAVERATESFARIENRSEQTITHAEEGVSSIVRRVAKVTDSAGDAQAQADRVEAACENAGRIEPRVTSLSEQLSASAATAQEQMESLESRIRSGEAVTVNIDSKVKQASTTAAETETKIAALVESVNEAANACERKQVEAACKAEESSKALREELSSIEAGATVAIEGRAAKLVHEADLALRSQQEISDSLLAEHRMKIQDEFKECQGDTELRCRAIEDKLREVHTRSNAVLADTQTTLDAFAARIKAEFADAKRVQQEAMREAKTEFAAEMEAHNATLAEMMNEFAISRKQVEASITVGREQIDEVGERLEVVEARRANTEAAANQLNEQMESMADQAKELVDTTGATVNELSSRADDSSRRLSDVVQRAEKLMLDVQTNRGQIEGMQHQISGTLVDIGGACQRAEAAHDLLPKCEQIAARLEAGGRAGEDAARKIENAAAAAAEGREGLRRIVSDADTRIERLNTAYASTDALLDKVCEVSQEAQGVLEQTHEAVELAERGALSAREHTEKLMLAHASGEHIINGLSAQAVSSSELKESIESVTKAAVQGREDLQGVLSEANTRIERLNSASTSADDALGKLNEVSQEAQGVLERAHEAVEVVGRGTHRAGEQTEKLMLAQASGEQVINGLSAQVASASELKESIESLAADAEGKIGQLDAHNAALGIVLDKLADAGVHSDQLIVEVNLATQAAHQAVEAAERMTETVKQQSDTAAAAGATAEEKAAKLDELVASATQLHGALATLGVDADGKISKLDSHAAAAGQVLRELAEANREVRTILQQTDVSAKDVRLASACAEELDVTIRGTIDTAGALHARLTEMDKSAAGHRADLEKANARAEGLIEQHELIKQQIEQAGDRVGEHVNATDSAIDTGQRLLREFATQSEDVGRTLESLHRKAAKLESAVSEATAKPGEVIADAKMRAAQLEKICGAVRKVSAGLSRKTLDSKRQLEELSETSARADDRLSKLAAQTDQSTSTLREWVNEAIQVQSRLDRTLRRSPSIRETHSGDSLQEIYQASQPIALVASPGADVGRLSAEDAPRTVAADKPRGKVEEIAQLIEEAKRASGATT